MLQQQGLGLQAAAEAVQPAVRTDDAVTGDDDRDRVGAAGGAGGAIGARRAGRGRQGGVGYGLAEGDGRDGPQDAALEVATGQVEGQVEGAAPAIEILAQLALCLVKQRRETLSLWERVSVRAFVSCELDAS